MVTPDLMFTSSLPVKWRKVQTTLCDRFVVSPVVNMQIRPPPLSGWRHLFPAAGRVPCPELNPEFFPSDWSQQKGTPHSKPLATAEAACICWLVDQGSVQGPFASGRDIF